MNTFFNSDNLRYAVIGSGSWATAIVKLLCETQSKIGWYIRSQENIDFIKQYGHSRSYLQSASLNRNVIEMSNDIDMVVREADVLIVAIPSAYFVKELSKVKCSLDDKFIISAVKGFVTDEHLTVAEYFNRLYNIPFDRLGVISGPCHAEEVSMGRLSYLTLSSKHQDVADELCKVFQTPYSNTVPCIDIYGVEYGAALKNIYAVGAGICSGLGYGDNFMAVYISSAFNEMVTFLNISHPDKDRVTEKSAYLGDLLVTCYSQFSRNRTFGAMLGKGYSVQTAQLELKMIAEGYYSVKALKEINKKFNVNMPIADAVYDIMYNNASSAVTIKNLLNKLQ